MVFEAGNTVLKEGRPLTTSVTAPWPIAGGGTGRDDAGGRGEDVTCADVEAGECEVFVGGWDGVELRG